MGFFRRLDLYKAIILLCLVALPVCGWWCLKLDESIDECKIAIREATRPGGLLEQIGALQKKVELVVQNRHSTSDAIKIPETYFAGQILAAASQDLQGNDFGLEPQKEEPATLSGGKQKANDFIVGITWKRKDLAVKLAFIYAVIFNCESGNMTGVVRAGQQSVWKLRDLEIVNATDEKAFNSSSVPPPELEDRWMIKKMAFARREPRAR